MVQLGSMAAILLVDNRWFHFIGSIVGQKKNDLESDSGHNRKLMVRSKKKHVPNSHMHPELYMRLQLV